MKNINDKPAIAIISPEEAPYSATFIKAHIDLLDADIKHLHGIFFPVVSSDQKYELTENQFVKKLFSKLKLKKTYKGLFKDPALAYYLKKEKTQLVLAEFGPVGAEVLNVCKQLKLPLIVHFHGYDAYAYTILSRYEKLYHEMFAYASYLVVVSKDMRQQLVRLGAPEDKLILNPYGPDDTFFKINPEFEAKNFVAVGRFVDKKAPDLTIAAFSKVLKAVPEAKLIMAGDGPLFENCQQLGKDYKIQNAVKFLGAISHEEVVKLYREGYCFVQHSTVAPNGDAEGTPVSVLEASAAGLPIVATKHAGIQDVVIHDKTGFLVAEKDVEAMAAYMIKLGKDKNLARAMGKEGRKIVRESFTLDNHINVINRLIENTLKNAENI